MFLDLDVNDPGRVAGVQRTRLALSSQTGETAVAEASNPHQDEPDPSGAEAMPWPCLPTVFQPPIIR